MNIVGCWGLYGDGKGTQAARLQASRGYQCRPGT